MENMFPVCSVDKMIYISWIGVRYLTADSTFLAQQSMKPFFIICSLKKLEGQCLSGALLTSISDGLAIWIIRLTALVFKMLKRTEHDLNWQKSIDTGTKHRPCSEVVINKMFKNYFTKLWKQLATQNSVASWISKKSNNVKIDYNIISVLHQV